MLVDLLLFFLVHLLLLLLLVLLVLLLVLRCILVVIFGDQFRLRLEEENNTTVIRGQRFLISGRLDHRVLLDHDAARVLV